MPAPPAFDPVPHAAPPTRSGRQRKASPTAEWSEAKATLPAEQVPAAPPFSVAVEVELDPGQFVGGYAPRGIDVELRTVPQRVTLKLLTATLVAGGANLLDGTAVKRPAHAIAWLLEQLAVEMPQPVLDDLMGRAK